MIKNISRALTCLFVGAALTACTGDDTGDSDTDPTTTASTDPTATTTETGTTTDATDTTTDSTESTTTTTTDATSVGTDTDTTTTDGTDTDSTTDTTTTTTDGTTEGTTDGTTEGTTDTTTTTDGGMGFAADVYPIISASCSCHLNGPKAGLEMPDAETAYANLVDVDSTQAPGVLRVAPDMPGASYIINKIEGTHQDVGGKGNQMPPGGPLSPDKVMTFKDWIADGAMP